MHGKILHNISIMHTESFSAVDNLVSALAFAPGLSHAAAPSVRMWRLVWTEHRGQVVTQ